MWSSRAALHWLPLLRRRAVWRNCFSNSSKALLRQTFCSNISATRASSSSFTKGYLKMGRGNMQDGRHFPECLFHIWRYVVNCSNLQVVRSSGSLGLSFYNPSLARTRKPSTGSFPFCHVGFWNDAIRGSAVAASSHKYKDEVVKRLRTGCVDR